MILLNGQQDARPKKPLFRYDESPTKRSHSRESLSIGQNPRALGRIRSYLQGCAGPADHANIVCNGAVLLQIQHECSCT